MAHNYYTEEEIEFIKSNYEKMTDEEISLVLNKHTSLSIGCKRKRLGLHRTNKKYSFDDLQFKMKQKGYELLSFEQEYKDCLSPMKYICPKHREKGIQITNLGHLNEGKGCIYCGFERTGESELIPEDKLKEICNEKHIIYVGRQIKNGCTHIRYICSNHLDCGEQIMSYRNMIRPYIKGCKYCSKLSSENFCSKPVLNIQKVLDNMKVRYIKEYTFKDCKDQKDLPFDFFLPKYNACIEYDDKHHFMPVTFGFHTEEKAQINFLRTQLHDKIKNRYCNNNHIPLLRINYKQKNKIEQILLQWLGDLN